MKNIWMIGTALSVASLSIAGSKVRKFQNIALATSEPEVASSAILSENSVGEMSIFQCQGGKSFTGSFTLEQAIVLNLINFKDEQEATQGHIQNCIEFVCFWFGCDNRLSVRNYDCQTESRCGRNSPLS
ncbi:hypothetical protein [Myxosarcina sp. GI1]|uniref:hypothetical protein n=1 Tax=Myxosarcina sp. GI1 TaxID=1541065 RepID=UPI00209E887C|nr:hypothetical protein [Myxosarcina sp. GI1]